MRFMEPLQWGRDLSIAERVSGVYGHHKRGCFNGAAIFRSRHVHGLVSLDRSPRRVEFTKALLGLHAAFDRSMILLQDIVQVLDRPVAATASQDSFLFHS